MRARSQITGLVDKYSAKHGFQRTSFIGRLPVVLRIIGADDGEEAVATAEPVISLQTFAFIKYAGIKYFSCFGFRSPYDEIRRSPKDNGVLNLIKTGFKL